MAAHSVPVVARCTRGGQGGPPPPCRGSSSPEPWVGRQSVQGEKIQTLKSLFTCTGRRVQNGLHKRNACERTERASLPRTRHRVVTSAQNPLPDRQSQPQSSLESAGNQQTPSSPSAPGAIVNTQPQNKQPQQNSTIGKSTPELQTPPGGAPLPLKPPPSLSPTDVVAWGGTLPSSRRVLLGAAAAASLSLGSNFLNVTSLLLSTGSNAQRARELRLDVVYPVQGFRRCYDAANGFEFLYPGEWLADQRLANMAVRQAELQRPLDPPPLRPRTPPPQQYQQPQQQQLSDQQHQQQQQQQQQQQYQGQPFNVGSSAPPSLRLVEPLAAFKPRDGPRGLNLSVVVQGVSRGFRLEDFNDASEAGAFLLNNIIAPPGSNLKSTLLSSKVTQAGGVTYAVIGFVIEGPTYVRRNESVFCTTDGGLVTLNVQAPEKIWASYEQEFRIVIDSFKLIPR